MEIIQFDFAGRGAPDIAETVYESLLGQLIPACQIPWVENIFVPGHACYEAYEQMLSAYARLREDLGEPDEDKNAEEMIDSLLTYSKIIALEMFSYGRKFQKMLDGEEN